MLVKTESVDMTWVEVEVEVRGVQGLAGWLVKGMLGVGTFIFF